MAGGGVEITATHPDMLVRTPLTRQIIAVGRFPLQLLHFYQSIIYPHHVAHTLYLNASLDPVPVFLQIKPAGSDLSAMLMIVAEGLG